MTPQAYATKVLGAKKGKYPTLTRRQAAFAKNFGGAAKKRAAKKGKG